MPAILSSLVGVNARAGGHHDVLAVAGDEQHAALEEPHRILCAHGTYDHVIHEHVQRLGFIEQLVRNSSRMESTVT